MPRDVPSSVGRATCAECALDAIVIGGALITFVQAGSLRFNGSYISGVPGVGPRGAYAAERMELLAQCGRAGLLARPQLYPVTVQFEQMIREFAGEPSRMRRVMVATMDRLVGTGWAATVLGAVEGIGRIRGELTAEGELWLRRVRAALALSEVRPALACSPPSERHGVAAFAAAVRRGRPPGRHGRARTGASDDGGDASAINSNVEQTLSSTPSP